MRAKCDTKRDENSDVYLGLGSNLGDSLTTVQQALSALSQLPEVRMLKTSRMYQTTPVSDIPQGDYINAACCLHTTLSAFELLHRLQMIEKKLGKKAQVKNGPRAIDIDILIFKEQFHDREELQIPHPRWKERLFVLMPLLDLAEEIVYPVGLYGELEKIALRDFLKTFPNIHHESVFPLNKTA